MQKSFIYVFTGNGGGKTLAALGLALRTVGQGRKVIVIQFMKRRKNIGEFKIQKKLGKNYKVYQFGRAGFVNLKKPSEVDYKLAEKGFEFAKEIAKKEKPDLLILDEINLAVSIGLLKLKDVTKFLRETKKKTDIVLTGRYAPKDFINIADGVSEIIKIKHTFNKGIPARRGIEY